MSHTGSIKRDPARGTWTVVVDVDGPRGRRTQIKRRGFATKRAAQAALNELLNESRDGLFVAGAKVTAGAYLREWLDGLSTSGRRTSTITRYRGLVERHALPELATLQLTDVNALHLDAVYRKMHTGGLSARSIRFLHTVLHRAFADAERKRLLGHSSVAFTLDTYGHVLPGQQASAASAAAWLIAEHS